MTAPGGTARPSIVVIGQTPPPYHGQSLMIERMLLGNYSSFRLIHVRMAFSTEFSQMRKFRLSKVVELFRVVGAVFAARIRNRAVALYFPPSGPEFMPMARDIAVLCATRWLFAKTIFHFHAGGLASVYPRLPFWLKPVFRRAYMHPDLSIRLSSASPEDGAALAARQEVIIPNGIEDHYREQPTQPANRGSPSAKVLFVGMLSEAKGVLVLLEALRILQTRGLSCALQLMGRFASAEDEANIRRRVVELDRIGVKVELLGQLTGEDKHQTFAGADIFCFPTHYHSESLPVVLIEAMSFGLPIVTTAWRGIPSMLEDNRQGFIVKPHDAEQVATALGALIADPGLRHRLGSAGRQRFLERYTVDAFRSAIELAFSSLLVPGHP